MNAQLSEHNNILRELLRESNNINKQLLDDKLRSKLEDKNFEDYEPIKGFESLREKQIRLHRKSVEKRNELINAQQD